MRGKLASSLYELEGCKFEPPTRCLLVNAFPEGDFVYRSRATAVPRSETAM